ncbi:pyocin activator PrtN family protein [Photobacterium leiognathi]|uniref:pyocin activator PrtN family protein n=1 Tax=Photobacterium leiognathi TaxID=553611 RepID=UPI002981CA62|nr:pyocin activator PrtN family protein [Photobacterium leiognathi]
MRNQTTLAALLAKYDNQILVPLSVVCEEFLGVNYRVARRQYAKNRLLIPIVRLSNSQKAPLLVHLEDLACFIELQRSRAKYQ